MAIQLQSFEHLFSHVRTSDPKLYEAFRRVNGIFRAESIPRELLPKVIEINLNDIRNLNTLRISSGNIEHLSISAEEIANLTIITGKLAANSITKVSRTVFEYTQILNDGGEWFFGGSSVSISTDGGVVLGVGSLEFDMSSKFGTANTIIRKAANFVNGATVTSPDDDDDGERVFSYKQSYTHVGHVGFTPITFVDASPSSLQKYWVGTKLSLSPSGGSIPVRGVIALINIKK